MSSLDAPPVLEGGALEVVGLLPRSSNSAFLATARLGGDEALVVYKPRSGEQPLWDFPVGTLADREVAAFVVARALGWPSVPPTVLRDGPAGEGAVQLFVPFDPKEHAFTLEERFPAELRRIALFDVVVNNADRKAGHCLLAQDGHLFVVDHGTCFHDEPKLRTVLWGFVDEAIADADLDDLRRLQRDLHDGPTCRALSSLLSPAEVRATTDRLDGLLAAKRFPAPGLGRPYPWPIV